MSLKTQLMDDMKAAMKAKEAGKQKLAVIRMVRSAIRQTEIDGQKELDDNDVIALISKEVKMRRDSIDEFKKGGREDLVAQTEAEIAVLMPYLPKQLSNEELEVKLKEIIARVGATSGKDMGKVMGVATKELAGLAEGRTISAKVKELLG